MDLIYLKTLETLVAVLLYFIAKRICFKVIDKTLRDRLLQESRGLIIKRLIYVVLLSVSALFILLIWGVDQAELAIFMSSVLTIVGVAFFAQWSLLSNITSSILLFFNHPIKLADTIMILEGKDYVLEGKVMHIGLFFTTLQTSDGEELALPNNVFIQKSIKRIDKSRLGAEQATNEASSLEENQ
ncbi:MAG: mechanosensitive ion channel family protein [Bacteroidota bacterium]